MALNVKRIYDEQKARARQHTGSEDDLARYLSKRLISGEAGLKVAAMYFCEKAGDDRRGADAQAQATVEGALDLILAAHRQLSILAAQRDLLDIPGEGGR
ncbi:MAG: hypothetical protein WA790_15810 [Sulfitobacter sp.]